jgi:hypothetical protein
MCGAQAGYPHDAECPFPLFRGSAERRAEWEADRAYMVEWRAKWAATEKARAEGMTAGQLGE